jgi:hypothetical protein
MHSNNPYSVHYRYDALALGSGLPISYLLSPLERWLVSKTLITIPRDFSPRCLVNLSEYRRYVLALGGSLNLKVSLRFHNCETITRQLYYGYGTRSSIYTVFHYKEYYIL